MLIASYLLYVKHPEMKSGFFLVESTNQYPPFHSQVFQAGKMAGRVGLYKSTPAVNAKADRQPAFTLGGLASSRISGIFFPDIYHPTFGFGDVHGTNDLLLVEESPTNLKAFVLKDRKAFHRDIFQLWGDGELSDEMTTLIQQAVPAQGPKD